MAEVRPGPWRESVGVTIDTNMVGPFLESKMGGIRAALSQKMDYWDARLQQIIVNDKLQGQLLKHRTGKLGDSVRAQETIVTPEEISGGVTAGGGPVDYARPLEYGAKAHLIEAVNAKALHFFIDGKEFFRKSVMHPGVRAYAFMRGTLDEQSVQIQSDFQESVNY